MISITPEDRLLDRPEARRSLLLMCLLAVATGIIAGAGAWAFRMMIGLVHNVLFLGDPSFYYDANVHTPTNPWSWGVVLVPVMGSVVVAWLVKNFAPEAKGHGVPEVMDAIYYNEGRIRPRVAIVKSVASAISIGSGGSVGREGPIVQIGSAFGSALGQFIRMPAGDRIALIAAGSGAGIAATFNAPLGGVAFAMELLLIAITARNILVVAITSVVAIFISHQLLGTQPSFYIPALEVPDFSTFQGVALAQFLVLGVVMGLLSVIFIRGLYWMEDVFDAIPGNYYTRHALGMVCVGLMIYLLYRYAGHYYIEGVGYATVMDVLSGLLTDPWFLLLLLGLKLLATWLSLGSGASGGVFSPALFVGAAGGALFGQLCQALIPGLDVTIPTFAIAGMAAVIAGSTGAVLTGIIMLTEMTRDPRVILPLIITTAAAYAVRKTIMTESIYSMKLIARGHSVPEGFSRPFAAVRRVADVMGKDFVVVPEGSVTPIGHSIGILASKGVIAGVAMQRTPADTDAPASVLPAVKYAIVGERVSLLEALQAMGEAGAAVLLVSAKQQGHKAEDIVGVLTLARAAQLLEQVDETG
jgi:CIC family chloride channel protein